MRTKLFHRLSYLLCPFQISCFVAWQRIPLHSTSFSGSSNEHKKIDVVCNIHSEELQIEPKNFGNELLVHGFIRELEPKVANKIIPDCIMNLCVDFCRRMLPCDCIKEKYRELDIDEYRKKALNFFLMYKVEDVQDEKGKSKKTILHCACEDGHLGLAKLFKELGINIYTKDKNSDNALHWACWSSGSVEMVKWLLDVCKIPIETKGYKERTSFLLAAQKSNLKLAKQLKERGANINVKDKYGMNALHVACYYSGSIAMVEWLLDECKIGLETKRQDEKTPFLCAAEKGQLAIAKLLRQRGANINAKDEDGKTALHFAVQYKKKDFTELLIKNGADVNVKDSYGRTTLHFAVKYKEKDFTELLIKNGANVNVKEIDGRTALHFAVKYNNNKELVSFLIENKANINAKDEDGKTALHFAVQYKKKDFTELLIKNGANVNVKEIDGRTALHFAVKYNNNKELVSFLIENKANINAKDEDGKTALHFAVQYKKKDFTELLIKNGANVNVKDSYGSTTLHFAVQYNNNKELVSFLIENKANVNAKDKDGKTALYISVWYEKKNFTELLIKNGANVNVKDSGGRTALHFAVEYEKKNFTELLIKNGANVNVKDSDGGTALHFAVKYNNNKELVSFLIENKANINAKDENGRTALHYAVEYEKKNFTELLIKNGANGNVKDKWGYNALHLACHDSGSVAMVTWLLDECKIDIETKSEYKMTPFLYAASGGNLGIAKLLRQRGANIHANSNGNNALHEACLYSGSVAMVTWLLDVCKIGLETKGYEKRTPFLCAAVAGKLEIAKLLRQRGANIHAKNFWRKNALNLASSRDKEMIKWLSSVCKLKKKTSLNWFTG